jgi:2-dehydro-3-deoxyphosphooctonate aldolase (KDO 8-P synthase)
MKRHAHAFEIGAIAGGGISVGMGKLFLIAGPCVIESEAHVRMMADALQRVTSDVGIPLIFKASYDKANRTSMRSFRGPGMNEGTRILREVAKATGLPVLTDVHSVEECAPVAESVDVLQIPAFLCRQTDLLIAAGETGRVVNVKKGQFVAPADMRHAAQKVREAWKEKAESGSGENKSGGQSSSEARVILTERGASFGYNNLVVDMRSLPIMREYAPVVFDGTHSVQTPSSSSADGTAVSGGQPEFIPVLARAAVAAGVDGLFLEVHDNPAVAKSDGANALRLDRLKPLLEELLELQAVRVKHAGCSS